MSSCKTPVSFLQEYAVAKKLIPKYELVHNGVGTHNPEFVYRVEVNNLVAEGRGRTKQEAKHRSAEKLLSILKIPNSKTLDKDDCDDSFMADELTNYVGDLKEYCKVHHYPEPNYDLEEEAGPPHNKVFKINCHVSQSQDSGVAKTKKMAKQIAARKMLERLKQLENEENEDQLLSTCETAVPLKIFACSVNDEESSERCSNLKTGMHSMQNKDPVILYKDHHNAYIGLDETSLAVSKLLEEHTQLKPEDALKLLNEIADELGLSVTTAEYDGEGILSNSYTIVSITLAPPIAGIGVDEKSAALDLLQTLAFFLR